MKNFPSLTAVCHQVLLDAPNGLDASTIARIVGRPYNTLMSELSRQPGHKFGADFILPICSATGSNLPAQVMCRALGGAFVPLVRVDTVPSAMVVSLAISVREFGEFASDAAEGIADGKISHEELESITIKGHEAIEAILHMVNLAAEAHHSGR